MPHCLLSFSLMIVVFICVAVGVIVSQVLVGMQMRREMCFIVLFCVIATVMISWMFCSSSSASDIDVSLSNLCIDIVFAGGSL